MTPGESADGARSLAIVHDYLIQMGGAEQVVVAMHKAFPSAPVFTSVLDPARLHPGLRDARLSDTWMRRLPRIHKHFKAYFPLYPSGFRSLGRLEYDAALISSSGYAKWARFAPNTITICYCHTPARFMWMPDEYLEFESIHPLVKSAAKALLPLLRRWDYRIAQDVDYYIANSEHIRARIQRCYGRESTVIYPPVDLQEFKPQSEHRGYYLIASRLVGYKRIDAAVAAFSANGRKLIVVGDGPDLPRLRKMAGPAVEFTGWLPRKEMLDYLHNCYAFVFTGREDFGITPVEAQAAGKPVLAFGAGGVLETVVPGETGQFFEAQSAEAINAALPSFEAREWNAAHIAAHAQKFGEDRFIRQLKAFTAEALAAGKRLAGA